MWGRLLVAGGALALLAAGVAVPSFAALTSATDPIPKKNHSDAAGHALLFGSREIYSQSTWRFKQWTDMLARNEADVEHAQHVCSSLNETRCVPAEWHELVDRLRGLDLRRQIALDNQAMNRHPYVPTKQNWHRSMYWETAFEFLRYGGQCQDYAIAKYLLLRAAGIPADQMRMVVLRDTAVNLDHAVLAVYIDGEPQLLDNLRSDIVPASSVSEYRPYYSINENGWWYHFGGRAMTRVADNGR